VEAIPFSLVPTPNAMEGGATSRGGDRKGKPLLGGLAKDLGTTSGSPGLPTAEHGGLAPEYSRWLMGYPEAWDRAAPGAEAWNFWQRRLTAGAASGATGTALCPR